MELNNTNITKQLVGKIDEYLDNSPYALKKFLKEYQIIPYNYIMEKNIRGLLVFHSTGTGKTLTAVSISERFRNYGKDIIVVSSKSLQGNYKKELKFYNKHFNKSISDDELEKIYESYKFVTSNASNMIEQLKYVSSIDKILGNVNKVNLNNKIIIIDEAHNLFNSIVNGAKNATTFYELLMNAKNIKLILLTATPIINNIFEIVPALNMCVGKIYESPNSKRYTTILPENYDDFSKYFIDMEKGELINMDKFKNRVLGLVSYVGDLYTTKQGNFYDDIFNVRSREGFPIELPIIIEKIKMGKFQIEKYDKARKDERLENEKSGGSIEKKSANVHTSYRIKSRQLSNIYIPKELDDMDWDDIMSYSPKIKKLYNNINNKHTCIIYSGFLKHGLLAVAKYLEHNGYTKFDPNNIKESKKKYALFSGDVSAEDRSIIINTFSNINNKNGSFIHIMLLSSSGSEGISINNCRQVHILEPYWNYERISQVSARAIRYHSHSKLPESEQNVQVYIYLSIFPDDYLLSRKRELQKNILLLKSQGMKIPSIYHEIDPPTDIQLFKSSVLKKQLNNKMLKILASISIECNKYNNNINFDCYNCVNNNRKLYLDAIDKDILMPSPCIESTKVKVNEIVYKGKIYYYNIDGDNIALYEEEDGNYHVVYDDAIKKMITDKVFKS